MFVVFLIRCLTSVVSELSSELLVKQQPVCEIKRVKLFPLFGFNPDYLTKRRLGNSTFLGLNCEIGLLCR